MTQPDNRFAVSRRTILKSSLGMASLGMLAGCSDDANLSGANPDADFPEDDVTLIIPYGPGGGYDTYVRLVAPYLSEYLPNDVDVQVQNVEGAGGQIATDQVYNANANGYQNMIVNVSDFAMVQLEEDVDYDLRKMTWYGQIAEDLRGIGVGKHTGIESWSDYVEAVQNEELRFYSPGPGSGQILVPSVIGELSGLYPAKNVVNNTVVYDGRGEAFQGMLAEDVDVMAGTYYSIVPYIEEGDVTMIMTGTLDENPPELTPESATFATEDISDADKIVSMISGRRAFAGPPDIPEEHTNILRKGFQESIADEEFRSDAEQESQPINYLNGEDTRKAEIGRAHV